MVKDSSNSNILYSNQNNMSLYFNELLSCDVFGYFNN